MSFELFSTNASAAANDASRWLCVELRPSLSMSAPQTSDADPPPLSLLLPASGGEPGTAATTPAAESAAGGRNSARESPSATSCSSRAAAPSAAVSVPLPDIDAAAPAPFLRGAGSAAAAAAGRPAAGAEQSTAEPSDSKLLCCSRSLRATAKFHRDVNDGAIVLAHTDIVIGLPGYCLKYASTNPCCL